MLGSPRTPEFFKDSVQRLLQALACMVVVLGMRKGPSRWKDTEVK